MGSLLLRFLRFWYGFIVGDDWTVAAGVIVALAGTSRLARHSIPVWWVMPAAVLLLLVISLRRAAGSSSSPPAD